MPYSVYCLFLSPQNKLVDPVLGLNRKWLITNCVIKMLMNSHSSWTFLPIMMKKSITTILYHKLCIENGKNFWWFRSFFSQYWGTYHSSDHCKIFHQFLFFWCLFVECRTVSNCSKVSAIVYLVFQAWPTSVGDLELTHYRRYSCACHSS